MMPNFSYKKVFWKKEQRLDPDRVSFQGVRGYLGTEKNKKQIVINALHYRLLGFGGAQRDPNSLAIIW